MKAAAWASHVIMTIMTIMTVMILTDCQIMMAAVRIVRMLPQTITLLFWETACC
jgi:hypothetical protein